MSDVPKSHPRYQSLRTRHRIEAGVEQGITSKQGLIAEGRGEAFDYLLGERTIESANQAARVAAAHLLLASDPVISVNGNVAALVPNEIVNLADSTDAELEINLFNRTDERVNAIASHLREHGAERIKGQTAEARIPGIDHARSGVDPDGIIESDVVVVPLEDGDRAEALSKMGKTEIVIDLNPLSRSARSATVPVIDNVIRAVPNITAQARSLREVPQSELECLVENFDPAEALAAAENKLRRGDID